MSENEMLEDIKSLSPSEEAILTMLIRYQNLKAELEKEKEKNKELEDTLKQTQNSWYEDTKVIEKQQKEIEEAEQKEKKAYIDGTNVAHELCNKYWKDKIKAKIEEVSNGTYDAKIVLQSLLEKE